MKKEEQSTEEVLNQLHQKYSKKRIGINVVLLLILIGIVIAFFFTLYSYFYSPEKVIGLGADIDNILISEDEQIAYLKLKGGSLVNVSKIKFTFSSGGNNYVYETSEGVDELAIPYEKGFFDWLFKRQLKGVYNYNISVNDIPGLKSFEDLDEINVVFEYKTETGQVVDSPVLDTQQISTTSGGGGGGGGSGGGSSGGGETGCIDTCNSLNYQCEIQSVCGANVDCGSCGSGEYCDNGICFASSTFPEDYISWWKFDGDATDETGRNNGSLIDNATTSYDIQRDYNVNTTGEVLSLDGNGDYVRVLDDDSLDMNDKNFSFTFWLKTKDIDNHNGLISKGYGSGMEYRIDMTGSGHLYIMLQDFPGNWKLWTPSTELNDGEWKHTAVIFERHNSTVIMASVYINGNLFGKKNLSVANISNVNNLYIGKTSSFYTNGLMDDVMIFNRSLSAAEIQKIYNTQKSFCTGIEKCSDYTDSNNCSSNPCNVNMNCQWNGANCLKAISDTWYVRPFGGNYGNEDGSDYNNSWDGIENLLWEKIDAGDTLYICGLHLKNYTSRSLSRAFLFNIRTNGLDENSRITIRGDCPDDQGILWNVGIMNHETWVNEGNNIWSITEPPYGGYFEDITASSWKVLNKTQNMSALQATAGSYFTNNSRFYVHTSDSGNPTNRIATNNVGYRIKLKDNHYITWLNLELYAMGRQLAVLQAPADYVTYMRWENVTNWYSGFRFRENSHHIEFINCDIAWAGFGIATGDNYPASLNDAPHHITVRGCKIHDIYGNSDSEAIGVQGTSHWLIENNEFYNVGSGITFYTWSSQEQKNNTIRWNWVHDTHSLYGARDRGIELNHDASHKDSTGNRVYGNIVGPGVDGVGYRYNYMDEGEFYNNICYECGISFYANHGLHGIRVKLRNFISLNPQTYHIVFAPYANVSNYSIDSDYNIFWPDQGGQFKFFDANGGYNNLNFTEWQNLFRTGSVFDPNSIVADPMFVSLDPQVPADFKLLLGSPAIDNGTDVGLLFDFEGNDIPQGVGFDIGAYEYGGGLPTQSLWSRIISFFKQLFGIE